MAQKKLVLANGEVYFGEGFGSSQKAISELVVNTCMIGYQEIVSDPSYTDQIVMFSYPLIGNYGITDEDYQSHSIGIRGIVVREYNDFPSNFRYTKTLNELMEDNNISGISGVDTRKITRTIRQYGTMPACICSLDEDTDKILEQLKSFVDTTDKVEKVSCKKKWYSRTPNHRYTVVAIDCGIKHDMLKALNNNGCNVTVVPFDTSAQQILSLCPDGVYISNGPGDPTNVPVVAQTVKELYGKLPIFGVSLGYQIICLAFGAKIYKLKFGHRGGNHPIKNVSTARIFVASQNHGFAVDEDSLKDTQLTVAYKNLLDGTVEGVESKDGSVFGVQFQPENSNDTIDSAKLFDKFIAKIEECNKNA